jgi:hypothetical protein
MNVIEYSGTDNEIVYCIVDRTHTCSDNFSLELVKNISDYTLSNINSKGYTVFVGLDEDQLLQHSLSKGYSHALVLSTGNEFINGESFFNEIKTLSRTDTFIYGHILDRKDAYYELHHQCYLIDLHTYELLGRPDIGQQNLGITHEQGIPHRTLENIHDDYTPLEILSGEDRKTYIHQMHGYNLISSAMNSGHSIKTFPESIREHKVYYYPENNYEFMKKLSYAYAKYNYCMTQFVHQDVTDKLNFTKKYDQIITTASGDWFLNHINEGGNIIIYDYNPNSIIYYKERFKDIANIEFVQIDLLGEYDISKLVRRPDKNTLLNLTNVFNYEGTTTFCSLKYRMFKENELLNKIPESWEIHISRSSYSAFGTRGVLSNLIKPTWHMNNDWI